MPSLVPDLPLQIKKVKRLHYISGITISFFIVFHLINHLYSLLGLERHIEFMDLLRLFYRNTIAETFLVTAVFIQIVSGIKLFFKKKKDAKLFFQKLQIGTGLYLALFLLFHISAVFVGRYMLNLDTNIYFGIAGLNTFPFLLFFIPYYSLAIISFFGHIAAIHKVKMKKNFLGMQSTQQAYIIIGFGIVLSLLSIYGLTDGFKGIDIPQEYQLMNGKK